MTAPYSMTTISKHLDEIEGRLRAATPGPWRRQSNGIVRSDAGLVFWDDDGPNRESDYPLIAHAPTDLSKLLAAVREMHRALSAIDQCVCIECNCDLDAEESLVRVAAILDGKEIEK